MPPKESAETRQAIHLRQTEGLTIQEACDRAGIVPSTYHRAMKRRPKKKVAKRG